MMRRYAMLFLALALGLTLTAPVFAQSVLFGPKQYTRTAGPPNQFTDTFTLPAGTTAPYTLHVVNGNPDGTNRISSATVKLNGTQILSPSDFGQNVAVLDLTVTLQANNTLEIRLTSAPGSFITVSVLDTSAGTVPTTLTPNPLNLAAGGTGTLTATLAPAPTAAGSLTISSANPAVATVPASVSFATGQTTVPVTVTAVASGSTTITVTLNGGSAASQVTVTPPLPTITSFTPASGRVGDSVTITGANFVNVQSVTFNGVAAGTFTVLSTTILTAIVPTGATTGKLAVTDAAGSATSAADFLVIPTLDQFTPITGRLGTMVTLTGTGFTSTPAGNQVTIGGASATVQTATTTQLVVRVPLTAATGPIAVTVAGATGTSTTNFTVIALGSLAVMPSQVTLPIGSTQPFHATATFTDQSTLDVTSSTTWASGMAGIASVTTAGIAQGMALGTTTITGTLGSLNGSGQVQVIAASATPLPPDPATVEIPIDRTVATTQLDANAFLYTGENPIQTGVAAGTINAQRAAVLRGQVKTRDGFPLPGVTVTVLSHPEFGQTLTRPDGLFDLAVNGGDRLTVTYAKAGYLPAQRAVMVSWQDYTWLPEIVLIPLDPQVTAINLSMATTMQVARGSPVTDSDGPRQATLLFAPGTTATMTLPGGGTQALTALNVRATEYTVGAIGPKAMPAELPLNSAYTYAVEYSVDEAMSAGATGVQFSQPVITYVENFLGLPVGTSIPSGAYDRALGQWVGSSNGRIVKVLSVTGGLANLDSDGDGVADNALALSETERQQVAELYQLGTSLWRVPVTHFSPSDYNFGPGFSPVDVEPSVPFATAAQTDSEPCQVPQNSIIECQNQTLGERLAVAGTPYALHYQSDRVPGRLAAGALSIPLSGASLPTTLQRIDLEVIVAGQRFTQSFPPTLNQTFTFQWDGLDAYGRVPQGGVTYAVNVGYVYFIVYSSGQRWGANGSTPPLTPTQRRIEGTLWQRRTITPPRWDARAADGLGGWSLSVRHAYDLVSRALFQGNGVRRPVEALPRVITSVVAGGIAPQQLAAGPDGSLFIASDNTHRVWRRASSGALSPVAGTGTGGFGGDGGPATAARLNGPWGVALGLDGSVYIADTRNHRIRRVDPAGIITTVAGTGAQGFGGDGGPATAALLNSPQGVAVGPDGSVYIADTGNQRIRRLGPDGLLTTTAGTGAFSYSGDGGPALAASMRSPSQVAVAPDGSLYIVDLTNAMVRRVGIDGIIRAVTKNGFFCQLPPYSGDGGPAIDADIGPQGVTVGPDGTVYVAGISRTAGGCCCDGPRSVGVYQIDTRGIINRVAGTGAQGFSGDGGPATQALLNVPSGVAVSPDGSLYIADSSSLRTRQVARRCRASPPATFSSPPRTARNFTRSTARAGTCARWKR